MTFIDPNQDDPPQSFLEKIAPRRAAGWITLASCFSLCMIIAVVILWLIGR